MRDVLGILRFLRLLVLTSVLASPLHAASSPVYESEQISARLITAERGVAPDATTLSAGLEITLAEGWKTYWKSPGAVGFAPELDWNGSFNLFSAELLYPTPERFRAFDLENYGYSDAVTFPIRLLLEERGAQTDLALAVRLLVCREICIPEEFNLTLSLFQESGIDTTEAALLSDAIGALPEAAAEGPVRLSQAALSDAALTLEFHNPAGFEAPVILPDLGPDASFDAPEIVSAPGGRLWVSLPLTGQPGSYDATEIVLRDGAAAYSFQPELTPGTLPRPGGASGDLALIWVLALAFLGGLILNVMPCVLPVLTIKLSAALNAGGQSPARIRAGFVSAALGVMSFMLALAAALIALRAAGGAVGWGIQFQSAGFLAVMVAIMGLFAANMLGMFEIALPQAITTRLAGSGGDGLAGDFATGALAAVMATPCSAPFLGTAITVALASAAPVTLAIFAALGLGLALPYLLVAARPALLSALPRPGPWMRVVRLIMGAAVLATALWLASVLWSVAGLSIVIAILAVIALTTALLAWRDRDSLAAGLAALVLAAVLPSMIGSTPSAATEAQDTYWQPFAQGEIDKTVAAGSVVFVDITADWCLTCKANKALVLDRQAVTEALGADHVVSMMGDWTRPDDKILSYLQMNGRAGIPFNIVYGPSAPQGIALPELLSESAVMEALAAAR